jgi:CheY-like chemotaxis protein
LLYSNSSLEDIKLNLQSAHANNINNSSGIIANVLHTANNNNNNVETKETFNDTTSNNSIINSNSGVSSSSSSSSISSGSNSRNNSNNNMPHVANTIQQPSPSSIVVPVTIAQASSSSVVEMQVIDNILTRQTPEREIPTKVYKETSDITVLVIDDSAFHRLALRHVLEVCGYVVKCCSSANDALQELLENQYKYDLIMCDKNMPGVNGIEFIQQVKSDILLLHIPIILVSVVEELNDINKAMELGADDYLIKPVKKNMVQTLILKLQQWQKK